MQEDIIGISDFLRIKDQDSRAPVGPKPKRKGQRKLLGVFAIPLVLALFYFYAIGRDRYFVSSSVVVRKASESSASPFSLGSFLGGGNLQSLEDARYLKTYLESPQVLEELERTFNFRAAYAQRGLDLYPGVRQDASREAVHDVFRRQISVSLDETSGELKFTTLGFAPQVALRLNRFLTDQAEIFVNRLNQDVYRQQLGFAHREVALNANRVQLASQALQRFQGSNQVLDAKEEGKGSEGFISALQTELAKQRVQLATLRRQFRDPRAPEIEAVQAQVNDLQLQIQAERSGRVSPKGSNLNRKAAQQAELQANLSFAQDLYGASLRALEKTRVDSSQQQRFMAVLSKPVLPEKPWQYWRHKGFFTTLVVLLIGFALSKFLLGMADSSRN